MNDEYIDTVHNARIQPTKLQKRVFDILPDEINRLKEIRNLGLIARVMPSAHHTKFDHQLGVIHLLGRAAMAKAIPEEFKEAFEIAAAVYHIGHLPLTYPTEHALLLAASRDESIADEIREYCDPIKELPTDCQKCTTADCSVKGREPMDLVAHVLKNREWRLLYRLFTAAKIFADDELRQIIADKEFTAELLWIVIGHGGCKWHDALSRLDMLDYTLRDLMYASTVQLHCNIEQLIADEKAVEWSLLHIIERTYLEDNVYNNPKVRVRRALFEKAMARQFVEKPDLFKDMLRPESANSTDDKLAESLAHEPGFEDAFDEQTDQFRKHWEFQIATSHESAIAFEKELIHGQDPLAYPQTMNLVLAPGGHLEPYRGTESNALPMLLAARSFDQPEQSDLGAFMNVMRQLSMQYPAYSKVEAIHEALFEFLIGCPVRVFTKQLFAVMGLYIWSNDIQDDLCDMVRASFGEMPQAPEASGFDIGLTLGDEWVPLAGPLPALMAHWMITVLLKDEEPASQLGAAIRLAESIATNAHAIASPPSASLRASLKRLRDEVGQAALSGGDGAHSAGDLLEAFAFLDVICRRRPSASYLWIASNLKWLDATSGADRNEYDIVQVELSSSNTVKLEAWGCTTSDKLQEKKEDDLRKLNLLKNQVRDRFSGITMQLDGYYYTQGQQIMVDDRGRLKVRF